PSGLARRAYGRDVLAPVSREGKASHPMTMGAYFDESARDEETDPLAVAGFVFKPTAYKQFCRKWKAVLCKAGLRAMHMTDLVQGVNDFKGRTIPERQAILRSAVSAITDHAFGAHGVLADQVELERVCGPEWPARFGSSYTLLCQRAAQNTAFWLQGLKQ